MIYSLRLKPPVLIEAASAVIFWIPKKNVMNVPICAHDCCCALLYICRRIALPVSAEATVHCSGNVTAAQPGHC